MEPLGIGAASAVANRCGGKTSVRSTRTGSAKESSGQWWPTSLENWRGGRKARGSTPQLSAICHNLVARSTVMPYKDPEKQREWQSAWTERRRKDWFEGKRCVDCGTFNDLTLDHIGPNKKVNQRVWLWSKERSEVELAKFPVVCRSCFDKKRVHCDQKMCPRCQTSKPLDAFAKRTNRRGEETRQAYCRACNRAHKQGWIGSNRDKVNRNALWSDHRLRQSDLAALLVAQNGACAICRETFVKTAHIDHDHSCCAAGKSCCKCRRGLLCQRCNIFVGWLERNQELIAPAYRYLGW